MNGPGEDGFVVRANEPKEELALGGSDKMHRPVEVNLAVQVTLGTHCQFSLRVIRVANPLLDRRFSFPLLFTAALVFLVNASPLLPAEDALLATSEELKWSIASPIEGTIGFAGPFVGVSSGELVVAGGANFPDGPPWEGHAKVWHDDIFTLSSPDGKWKRVGKLPRPLGYGVSANWQGGIVCVGGSDAHGHSAEAFFLKVEDGNVRCSPLPALPVPVAMGAGALVGNTLYVAGGQESPTANRASSVFFALNLDEPSSGWKELESWPGPPRMLAVAGSLNGDFYLFSGAELIETADGKVTRRFLNDAWRCRAGEGWSRLPDLPRSVVAAPSPAVPISEDQLLILGGDDGELFEIAGTLRERHPGFSRTPLIYQAKTNSWRVAADVPRDLAPVVVESASRPPVAIPVTTGTTRWENNRFAIPTGEARPGIRTPDVLLLEVLGLQP